MRLVLQFLGLPQLQLNDQPIVTDRRKAIALLAYLAVNDIGQAYQRYSRESLSALLWPDYNQAKAYSNLRRTIWEVHQATGDSWLLADRGSVCLNSESEIDLDVARFRDLLAKSRQQTDPRLRIPLLSESVKLYRNHFLTGFSLKDAPTFSEWASTESEELRRQLADALTLLIESHCLLNQADYAIPHARRLIALDPLNELAHRQLMEVYLQAGQYSAALKQYQTCEQLLRQELGLDPQPETLALYKKIRKGVLKPTLAAKPAETVRPKHNLPSGISAFIGREKEQAEVINLISKNRIVTLSGIGGIGKTSLALQMGHKFLKDYPQGAWFVRLDSISDPMLVPQTVASVFDIREGPDRPLLERLTDSLREKTLLLILDNCEHVLDACASLSTTLLTKCPNLNILATSREILYVEGEATFPMPPLSLPEPGNDSIETLTAYESIQLFVERAALTLPSFTLTRKNARSVVEICRKVDGIPLVIELAAARVNILQVSEILEQLQNFLALLSTANRTTLSRHQTLQVSMDWSWGLLNEAEQKFMRQLSVFAGGWTLESARAICDGDVLNLTSALATKSMIVVNQESVRETRYRFHEIVRQYTREKMVEAGEEENIRTRHLKYFLEFSKLAESALKGVTQQEWIARLNDERDNIRTALEWADKFDVEAGLYLAGRLRLFWEYFDLREGARWLAEFVGKPESKSYPLARAKALYAQGRTLPALQQFDAATSAAHECLELYRACGDKPGEIDGLLVLGYTEDFSKVSEITELHQQALTLSKSLGDPWRQAQTLFQFSWIGNDYPRRIAYLKEAVTLLREIGDLQTLAISLSDLSHFSMLNGDLESTQMWMEEALMISQHLNNRAITGDILGNQAMMASRQGDYRSAHTNFQECITIAREVGNRRGLLWWSTHLGFLYLREGQTNEARNIFLEGAQDFYEDKNDDGVIFNFEGMARLYVAIGKPERAARLIGWADARREKIGDAPRAPIEQADVDRDISAIRAKIDSAAFEVAYDEGRAMTLEEAVAYAHGES